MDRPLPAKPSATYIACYRDSQLPFCGSSPVEKTIASQGSGQYTHVSECFGAFIFSSPDETSQDLWWLPFYMGWKGESFAKIPNLHGIISLFDTWFKISPFIYNLRQIMRWPRNGYMRIPHDGVRRISSWATHLHIIFWSKNGPKETMQIPIHDEVWSNHQLIITSTSRSSPTDFRRKSDFRSRSHPYS